MQPQFVDRDRALVLELVRPFAAVLVLRVLPLRSYALLEEVVIGLEAQFGGRCDVVLDVKCVSRDEVRLVEGWNAIRRCPRTLRRS